jgi:surface antigen
MVMSMFRHTFGLLFVLALGGLLSGCVTNGQGQAAGTGLGAVAGGIGGALIAKHNGINPVAGAVVGAVAGGIVGNAIGKALDDEERRQLALATQRAVEEPVVPHKAAAKVQWKRTDPQTKTVTASGWVVPKNDPYERADGTTCRDVTQTVDKGGETHSQDITLCKTQVAQADGSNWVIPQ